MKICIIAANYYPQITSNMLKGCLKVLKINNIKNYKEILSPGVFEIPVLISRNIKSHDAIIALGCVIKGDTPHFDFISKATFSGIINLSINHKKPIGNGIITCLNKSQALVRSDPTKKNKGGEAAKAVLSVLGILKNESK
jgi:6,7-dimethyl-8-ribityllumazine synthase